MSTAYRRAGDDDEPRALIQALEETEHELPLDEWAELLLSLDPAYAEPPPPQPCDRILTLDQRLELMTFRVSKGYRPVSPDDSWAAGADLHGGYVLRNGRNGATFAAEGVCDG